MYLNYIKEESISASVTEFSWDLKYAGAQVLLSEVLSSNESIQELLFLLWNREKSSPFSLLSVGQCKCSYTLKETRP